MALTEYEAGLCPDCGQPRHLSMDPDLEREWVSDLPNRCFACTAIEIRAKDYTGDKSSPAQKFCSHLRSG